MATILEPFPIPEQADNHPCIQGIFKQLRASAALIPITGCPPSFNGTAVRDD